MTQGYKSINPYNNEEYWSIPFDTKQEVQNKVSASIKAYNKLRKTPIEERKTHLVRFAEAIRLHANELALTISTEMGKPIKQAVGEVEKCALMAEFHAANAPQMLQTEKVNYLNQRFDIQHCPLGPTLFIATWNNPLLQAVLAFVPQYIIGNTALVKPAPNAPRLAKKTEEIISELGIIKDVYQVVYSDIPSTESILEDPRVVGVTFIGSSVAGHRVAQLAGKSFKRAVIDAGGSDPMIILKDANLEMAVEHAIASRFGNTGQSCIAAKRIIVHKDIKSRFEVALIHAAEKLKVGDPVDNETDIGPLATKQAKEKLLNQIEQAIVQGAKPIYKKDSSNLSGACVYPTILSEVTCEMVTSKEELFGPVAAIYSFSEIQEAIKIANDTPFGLGASIYGKEEVENIINELEVGNVAINTKLATQFPVPFGGIKDSGFGVYFGKDGLTTFCNNKVILTSNDK
jgi:succinate-semialdehyde dehydrogenase